VLWDLAVHDLSILDHVMPGTPLAVSAIGVSHVAGQPENIAYLTLLYPENRIAHLHVNWLAPVKVRRTLIAGSAAMIVYDDLEPSEKVKVYDAGAELVEEPEAKYRTLISYRQGDMSAPRLDIAEALQVEVAHFVDCIQTGATSITDGRAGLRIVQILEAAEESLRDQGAFVPLAGKIGE
jgi:predicted dehydrogenase